MTDALEMGLLAILGAVIGSFLATVAIRWPEGRSAARGRSACDGCGRTLTAAALVPLLSHAVQRGRCRSCGARIDPLHWQVELAAALVGLGAGLAADGMTAVAGAAFGWLLLLLAVLDLRAFWLPDRLTGLLAVAGLGSVAVAPPLLLDRLVGGAAGFASLWAIAAGYRRWRGREGMGGGDPKLLGAIGLWLGWRMLPMVVTAAAMIGLGAVLALAATGRPVDRHRALPFGTLLAAAAYPAWLLMIGMAS